MAAINPIKIADSFKTGFTNVVTNRIFQVVFVVLLVLGTIYYLGRKSAQKKVTQDQVILPSDNDPANPNAPKSTITQSQLLILVEDCHSNFRTWALMPGMGYLKTKTIKRMIGLTEQELAILNNVYNQRYVPLGYANLTVEIENDSLTSAEPYRSQILARLKALKRK